ncbi:MAG: hypothetical protein GY750_18925 [Lentisphaerae bacterium]|nr:hypothetical protein [Lentisphaerota bacterium]MCP4103472.1 hypothetical protein [Lentisphaerota bacterium]
MLGGYEYYWRFHHVVGHGLVFGLILSAILAFFAEKKIKCFLLFLALFHLHLVLDLLGSGPGWEIYYWWPFKMQSYEISFGWEFFSWQNQLAGALLLLWTIAIAVCQQRTPLEYIMPKLDQRLVKIIRFWNKAPIQIKPEQPATSNS